jgi:hypothetical protein
LQGAAAQQLGHCGVVVVILSASCAACQLGDCHTPGAAAAAAAAAPVYVFCLQVLPLLVVLLANEGMLAVRGDDIRHLHIEDAAAAAATASAAPGVKQRTQQEHCQLCVGCISNLVPLF